MPANRPAGTLDSEAAALTFFSGSDSPTERSQLVAFEGRLGRAYNEGAFRYLLGIEQARARRLGRPLPMALISLRTGSGEALRFAPRVAARVFDALWLCIRDVDLTGWYMQDRVAAALLTQDCTTPGADDAWRIQARIDEALRGRIPSAVAGGLRVRVLQMGATHSGGNAHPPGQNEVPATTAAPVGCP